MFTRFASRAFTRAAATPMMFKTPQLFQISVKSFTTVRPALFKTFAIPKMTKTTPNCTQTFPSLTQSLISTQRAMFHIKLKYDPKTKVKSRPHHASCKRFWATGSGRLMRFKSGMNHKRRRKTKAQLRRLSQRVEVPKQAYRRLTKMMMLRPYLQFPPGMSRPVNKFWQPPRLAENIKKKRWC